MCPALFENVRSRLKFLQEFFAVSFIPYQMKIGNFIIIFLGSYYMSPSVYSISALIYSLVLFFASPFYNMSRIILLREGALLSVKSIIGIIVIIFIFQLILFSTVYDVYINEQLPIRVAGAIIILLLPVLYIAVAALELRVVRPTSKTSIILASVVWFFIVCGIDFYFFKIFPKLNISFVILSFLNTSLIALVLLSCGHRSVDIRSAAQKLSHNWKQKDRNFMPYTVLLLNYFVTGGFVHFMVASTGPAGVGDLAGPLRLGLSSLSIVHLLFVMPVIKLFQQFAAKCSNRKMCENAIFSTLTYICFVIMVGHLVFYILFSTTRIGSTICRNPEYVNVLLSALVWWMWSVYKSPIEQIYLVKRRARFVLLGNLIAIVIGLIMYGIFWKEEEEARFAMAIYGVAFGTGLSAFLLALGMKMALRHWIPAGLFCITTAFGSGMLWDLGLKVADEKMMVRVIWVIGVLAVIGSVLLGERVLRHYRSVSGSRRK